VGGGGQLVNEFAQVVLDLSEGLVFGEFGEALGDASQDVLGVGPQLAEEGLDAGFTV
jgi:hypothetical protein